MQSVSEASTKANKYFFIWTPSEISVLRLKTQRITNEALALGRYHFNVRRSCDPNGRFIKAELRPCPPIKALTSGLS
jgi:hypothetical protein